MVETVSVILVVMGLTQFIKEKLGMSGNPAELLSFIIGFLLGGAFRLASLPTLPGDFAGWFGVILYAPRAIMKSSTGIFNSGHLCMLYLCIFYLLK